MEVKVRIAQRPGQITVHAAPPNGARSVSQQIRTVAVMMLSEARAFRWSDFDVS